VIYSASKALRHPEKFLDIRENRPTSPVHVLLVLSDLCNQNCSFCSYRDPNYISSVLFHENGNYNPNRKLPKIKAIEILDDCKEMGVKGIQFTGGGEPTVHPDFQEIVDYTTKLGLSWGLITNGVKLSKFDVSKASWVRVSLDASNSKTYSKIRGVMENHFDLACESIKKTKCGVTFTVTPDNWTEVYECAKLVKSLGANNFKIGPQFSEEDDKLFDGFYDRALELTHKAEELSDENFQVFNRFPSKISEIVEPPKHKLCAYQYFTTHIGADQNLYRCCVYAYNPYGLVGTIKNKRFKDAWYENWNSIAQFDATKCKGCHYKDINESLQYPLAKYEKDDEFV
jgi:MoaA/NifB/PqqE/SkfB family radical SAM enzyme